MAISPALGSSNTVRSSFRVEPGPRDKLVSSRNTNLASLSAAVRTTSLRTTSSPFAILVTRGSSWETVFRTTAATPMGPSAALVVAGNPAMPEVRESVNKTRAVVLRSILPSQISFGDRTAKINERTYKHAGWPAKSKYLLVFLGGGDKLLGGRKPSHIKGMIHSPWREARLGHFSAQLRVSAGRQPGSRSSKQTRIFLAGCANSYLRVPFLQLARPI